MPAQTSKAKKRSHQKDQLDFAGSNNNSSAKRIKGTAKNKIIIIMPRRSDYIEYLFCLKCTVHYLIKFCCLDLTTLWN